MSRHPDLPVIVALAVATTTIGVVVAFWLELQVLPETSSLTGVVFVGLVEESFSRLLPLVATFYTYSRYRGRLLRKTEGLLATIASGVTVGGLELALKLQYLSHIEAAARFDALVLPIVFIHLPFALVAGRFAYWLGERIHGDGTIGIPRLSRRTVGYLLAGYVVLVAFHVAYNLTVG